MIISDEAIQAAKDIERRNEQERLDAKVEQELDNCPFCGDPPNLVRAVGEYWVMCPCRSSSGTYPTRELAKKAWNWRVNND